MSDLLSQFGINWTLLIAQMVNFAVLVWVLAKFVYKPVIRVLDERRERIENSLTQAKSIEQKSRDANSSQHEDQGRPRHGISPIAGILSEFGPLTSTRPRLRKISSSPWRSEQGALAPAFTPGSAPAPLSVSGGGP